MSPRWRYFLIGYPWAALNTLVGLVMALVYRSSSWRWRTGCLEAIAGRADDGTTRILGKPGAQTYGWLIIYASERDRDTATLRAHERVHVVQAFIGGPLFALAYGILFLVEYAARGFTGWKGAYRANLFEQAAYRAQ